MALRMPLRMRPALADVISLHGPSCLTPAATRDQIIMIQSIDKVKSANNVDLGFCSCESSVSATSCCVFQVELAHLYSKGFQVNQSTRGGCNAAQLLTDAALFRVLLGRFGKYLPLEASLMRRLWKGRFWLPNFKAVHLSAHPKIEHECKKMASVPVPDRAFATEDPTDHSFPAYVK